NHAGRESEIRLKPRGQIGHEAGDAEAHGDEGEAGDGRVGPLEQGAVPANG
ncbi:hypothetical protein AC249_AIPGENE3668, partial [Exaiptasia diaphana]